LSKGTNDKEETIMKYTMEHVQNVFGSFWVIYEEDDSFEKEVFFSHDIAKTLKVLKELRGE
jgi:hypothetical protein